MKQKLLPLLLLMTFALTACAQTARAPGPSATAGTDRPDASTPPGNEAATVTCRIVDGAETGNLLLAEENGEIYTLSTASVQEDVPTLRDGMTVTVAYNGGLMETWPAQFGEVYSLTATDDAVDDRCGLYLQVLEDLWETDPGLNSDGDLKYLGMDLSGLTHLTAGEKAAVIWRFSSDHGLTPVEGTWEELRDAGYIDGENLVWEDGILFTITTDEDAAWSLPAFGPGEEPMEVTTFAAQKWRSGLGAYLIDCVGQQEEDGSWIYTVTGAAIS